MIKYVILGLSLFTLHYIASIFIVSMQLIRTSIKVTGLFVFFLTVLRSLNATLQEQIV